MVLERASYVAAFRRLYARPPLYQGITVSASLIHAPGLSSTLPRVQYDVTSGHPTRPRSPAYTLGTSSRDVRAPRAKDIPGPGAYGTVSGVGKQALSTRPSLAAFKFGTGNRGIERPSTTPGPGAYATDGVDSVAGRTVSSQRPRTAGMRFGTSGRPALSSSATPGPAYSPIYTSTRSRSPLWSFGKSSRDAGGAAPVRSNSPGPGAYEQGTDSIGRRQATTAHANIANVKFGSSNRFSTKPKDGPAPGEYGAPEDHKYPLPTTKFGTGARGIVHLPDVPGPGAYVQSDVRAIRLWWH